MCKILIHKLFVGYHTHRIVVVGSDGTPYLNFAKLIYRYSRLFASSAPAMALQYLLLITLNIDQPDPVGSEQRKIAYKRIGELVSETRQYEELIGSLSADGTHTVCLSSDFEAWLN